MTQNLKFISANICSAFGMAMSYANVHQTLTIAVLVTALILNIRAIKKND